MAFRIAGYRLQYAPLPLLRKIERERVIIQRGTTPDLLKTQTERSPENRQSSRQNPEITVQAYQSRVLRSLHGSPLIDGLEFDAFIADKAFDSNAIIAELDERGATVVISPHPRRLKSRPLDREMYKWRHLIENFFCKLKEFKRIAMRADKTDKSFSAMIYLAAAVIHSR